MAVIHDGPAYGRKLSTYASTAWDGVDAYVPNPL